FWIRSFIRYPSSASTCEPRWRAHGATEEHHFAISDVGDERYVSRTLSPDRGAPSALARDTAGGGGEARIELFCPGPGFQSLLTFSIGLCGRDTSNQQNVWLNA